MLRDDFFQHYVISDKRHLIKHKLSFNHLLCGTAQNYKLYALIYTVLQEQFFITHKEYSDTKPGVNPAHCSLSYSVQFCSTQCALFTHTAQNSEANFLYLSSFSNSLFLSLK